MTQTIRILPPAERHRADWERLYAGYAEFYRVAQTPEMRATVWGWIGDPAHEVKALVAETPEGRVAGLVGEELGGHRIGGHDLLPFGPFGVSYLNGNGAALADAVPDAAEDRDHVLLEFHPRTAAVAEAAAGQGVCDVPAGDFHTGGDALNNSHQSRTMGFTGSQPTHNFHPAT